MPGRFELKPTLAKIWHAPDNFRIMEPLPPMHRRGIIIAAIVLVIGFLLPASETSDSPVVTREAQLDLQSQSQPPTEAQLQAQLVAPQNDFRRSWSRRKTIRIRWRPLRRNLSRKASRKNKTSRKRSLSSRIAASVNSGARTG
ncbi:Diguanylate phosphodiesterase [Salmonella enterica subsp. enterica serovar Baildon str. R6-199]|nr:Diguanylate phosphodiesterase [Salmonella enterica subsp. enterica serovar Baildon str. R6-199]